MTMQVSLEPKEQEILNRSRDLFTISYWQGGRPWLLH